jgi:hypothetical protein
MDKKSGSGIWNDQPGFFDEDPGSRLEKFGSRLEKFGSGSQDPGKHPGSAALFSCTNLPDNHLVNLDCV